MGLELVDSSLSVALVVDEAGVSEDFEVLGECGVGDGEVVGEVACGGGRFGELLDDLPTDRVGECIEGVVMVLEWAGHC